MFVYIFRSIREILAIETLASHAPIKHPTQIMLELQAM